MEMRPTDRHAVEFSDFSMGLTNKAMATESEIATAAASNYRFVCGVYFLVNKGRVVYVGQATNVAQRIAFHVGKKEFDSYAFIQCEREQLDIFESLYIHFLKPPLNGGENKKKFGCPGAPISFKALVGMFNGSRAAAIGLAKGTAAA